MSIKQATVDSSTIIEHLEEKDRPIGSGTYGIVWNVLDPRNGKRVALKRITEAFDSRLTALMVFRELRMLCTFQHENVIAALDVLQPPPLRRFKELYILTELMHGDLHEIIWSKQPLSAGQIHMLMYQLMRGLKYLHSAKVIHRDIKPGNILVYDNCKLKICDFGLARAEVTDKSKRMSLNVVTSNYRAPEIFLKTKHYTSAIDIWAAACVFAEVLGRKVLFSSRRDVHQLVQMINLLGTPLISDIDYASNSMKKFVSRSPWKPSMIFTLHDLSPLASDEAVDLMSRMFQFNPNKRLTAAEVLDHPYMIRGRELYHSVLCECCVTPKEGVMMSSTDLEPVASKVFGDRWERKITSVQVAKKKIHRYIRKRQLPEQQKLCINSRSEIFRRITWED